MASRRSKSKGAIAGLRSIQTLGSLAVPVTLEQVPEESEVKSTKQEIFASNDWKSVQRAVQDIYHGNFSLEISGEFYRLHQNVKSILESKTGTFLRDCYKEWLTKEMSFTAERMKRLKGPALLEHLEDAWMHFFKDTLPLLDAIMYLVKPKGRVSIRGTTLATFRDIIALVGDIEGAIRYNRYVSPGIKHMILILQSVNDSYPPNKNKLRMENLASQICDIYLGYYGLYENGNLIVTSNEPMLAGKRRPSEETTLYRTEETETAFQKTQCIFISIVDQKLLDATTFGEDAGDAGQRRISRPFSIQPQALDTLDELFKKSVRHRN